MIDEEEYDPLYKYLVRNHFKNSAMFSGTKFLTVYGESHKMDNYYELSEVQR